MVIGDYIPWIVISVILIGGGSIIYNLITRHFKQYDDKLDKREKDAEKQEQEKIARQKKQHTVLDALKVTMKDNLLHTIKDCCNKGFTTQEDRAFVSSMWDLYESLGGNNSVPREVAIFDSLPDESVIISTRPDIYKDYLIRQGRWISQGFLSEWEEKNNVVNREMADFRTRLGVEKMKECSTCEHKKACTTPSSKV